jgi:ribosomal protein L18E
VVETPAEEPIAEEPVIEAPAEEPVAEEPVVEEPEYITAEVADTIVTDEDAEEKIEIISEVRAGRMVEINIGEINDNFEDGDTVTIKELKAKHLISAKAGRIKVLAGGHLSKKFTVVADKFSLQAVKMITIEGGTVKQYNA